MLYNSSSSVVSEQVQACSHENRSERFFRMAIKTTVGEAITWANEQIMQDVRQVYLLVELVASIEERTAEEKLAEWKALGTRLSFAVHGALPGDDGEPY